jgi:hypothetical protein
MGHHHTTMTRHCQCLMLYVYTQLAGDSPIALLTPSLHVAERCRSATVAPQAATASQGAAGSAGVLGPGPTLGQG